MNTRHGVVMCALAVGALGAVQAQELPRRKPGLWEFAMQMEGMPAGMPGMKSQHCVDEKSDQEMQRKAMSNPDTKQQCTQGTPRRSGATVEVDTTCKSAEGTMTMHSRISGDMSSSYLVDSTMTFTPPRHGMSESRMQIKAAYGGACPADMKPGEIRMAGMTFNPAQGSMNMKNMDPEALKKWAEQMKAQQGK